MTKEEAIKAMQDGKKVTHRYFSSNEWMSMHDGLIVLEDGGLIQYGIIGMTYLIAKHND